MSNRLLVAALGAAALFSATSFGQAVTIRPDNGGTGADGAFAPVANVTIDTSVQSVFNFTTVQIPAGVTVRVVGPTPMTWRIQGPAQIDGTIDARGSAGASGGNNLTGGDGGLPGPGGFAGGDAGCSIAAGPFNGTGFPGGGPRGGGPGLDAGPVPGTFTDPVGGGGGGGGATPGQPGAASNCCGPHAFSGSAGPGGLCRGGSGGGGGGGDIDSATSATGNDGGGGGGGGGGRLSFYSNGLFIITATGAIRAEGGAGGASTGNGGAGGGGGGGLIEIAAEGIVVDGRLVASGGAGGAATQTNCGCSAGGAGGDGCIILMGAVTGSGSSTPTAQVGGYALELSGAVSAGEFRVNLANPGDAYVTAFTTTLLPGPVPFPGLGNLFLDPTDGLFAATLGAPNLGTIITGMTNAGPGLIQVNLPPLPPTSAILYAQCISLNFVSNSLTGFSNLGTLRVEI